MKICFKKKQKQKTKGPKKEKRKKKVSHCESQTPDLRRGRLARYF